MRVRIGQHHGVQQQVVAVEYEVIAHTGELEHHIQRISLRGDISLGLMLLDAVHPYILACEEVQSYGRCHIGELTIVEHGVHVEVFRHGQLGEVPRLHQRQLLVVNRYRNVAIVLVAYAERYSRKVGYGCHEVDGHLPSAAIQPDYRSDGSVQ